jgi:hypothetical protein
MCACVYGLWGPKWRRQFWIFPYFGFLINIWEINLINIYFKSDAFESPQFGWSNLWKNHVISTGVTQLHGVTHPTTSTESRRLTWRYSVTPNELAWQRTKRPSTIFLPPLFLPSSFSSVAAAPLTILVIFPPYEALVALNHLHELVSGSHWVHMSSLPSHLIIF